MVLTWLLLLALLVPVRAQEADGELLANAGFNEDADADGLPDAWNASLDKVAWHEKAYMGKDYELVSKPGTYVMATQPIRLEPGEKYTLSFRARGEQGGIGGALIVHGPEKPTREMPILWNVNLTEDFEEYVGTFVAPNPVAVLYIYNIAKDKGTVAYDSVSLRKGDPDHTIIGQISLRPVDQPVEPALDTPHIPWATPTPEGPVKAFATIRTFRCEREFLDLCQCVDMDYDLIHTGYEGDQCVSETGRRATKRLQESYYETYVIPSRISGRLLEDIKGRVQAGAGLVIVEGFGQAGKLMDVQALQEAPAEHYVRAGVPWDMMPEKVLSSVQVGELGKGRVVRLQFPLDRSRVWGILPYDTTLAPYQTRQFEYWHWWTSVLSRAILWSAHREGQTKLAVVQTTPDAIALSTTDAPQGATARYMVRSARELRFDAPPLRTEMLQAPVRADESLRIEIPDTMPGGPVIADVMLLDAGGSVLDFGSFTTDRPQKARIVEVAADKQACAPGETPQVSLKLTADGEVAATIECKVIDPFGRVVWQEQTTQSLPAGESSVTFTPDLSKALRTHCKVFARVLWDGAEQDSRWCGLLIPSIGEAQCEEDFTVAPWGSGMTPPVQQVEFMTRTEELGLNAEFATTPYVAVEHGMPVGGYIGGAGIFSPGKRTAEGVRPKCLSDPAVIEEYKASARKQAALQQPYGLYAVGITDEGSLTHRHQRDEVCFSPHCLAAYR